jgi:Niemann-Pick C1 protein
VVYSLLLLGFVTGIILRDTWRQGKSLKLPNFRTVKHQESNLSGYDRLPLEDPMAPEDEDSPQQRPSASVRPDSNPLVGGTFDGENVRQATGSASSAAGLDTSSPGNSLSRHRLGRGASLLESDPLASYQPRSYPLDAHISRFFYKLGAACAKSPYLTIAAGFALCGIINAGWARFDVERDPVRLWVAKGSENEVAKNVFEEKFGPFYRTEQVFVSVADTGRGGEDHHDAAEEGLLRWKPVDEPVLNWDRLEWWAGVERDIRHLRTADGVSLQDVCFAPQADGPLDSPDLCVIQSFLGYFGDSLQGIDRDNWVDALDGCATSPASCLPASGQPLNPRLLFGGVPGFSGQNEDGGGEVVPAHEARAFVVTYVVENSLDPAIVARAEKWEEVLKSYLTDLSRRAPDQVGLQIAFSTGVSLEEELNKSTNTDVPIVVLSYLVMFFYVSLNLGGSFSGLLRAIAHGVAAVVRSVPVPTFTRRRDRPRSGSMTRSLSDTLTIMSPPPLGRLLVESKFLLGLFGIAIVLLSVSTSVGLFSFLGVKVTLIIAEVIPFLVLAIGVDNVFILSHEVERQTARSFSSDAHHGPLSTLQPADEEDLLDDGDVDKHASAEERVARALGRMGPSILLSASCETIAFGFGALVGMPAVRNFAIYAAGAVVVNALLQVTVFVAAVTIDLKRAEVGPFPLFSAYSDRCVLNFFYVFSFRPTASIACRVLNCHPPMPTSFRWQRARALWRGSFGPNMLPSF